MARSYYSTVFDQTADQVWAAIRDFGNYTVWIEGVDETRIEDGRPGDAVGAVRDVRTGDTRLRQRLLAHSDLDRSYTYEFCEPLRYPSLRDFRATLRVTPVVDRGRAFVEWWATFDCPADELDSWTARFTDSFATWLASLRASIAVPA
jgi:hypothetical protein